MVPSTCFECKVDQTTSRAHFQPKFFYNPHSMLLPSFPPPLSCCSSYNTLFFVRICGSFSDIFIWANQWSRESYEHSQFQYKVILVSKIYPMYMPRQRCWMYQLKVLTLQMPRKALFQVLFSIHLLHVFSGNSRASPHLPHCCSYSHHFLFKHRLLSKFINYFLQALACSV